MSGTVAMELSFSNTSTEKVGSRDNSLLSPVDSLPVISDFSSAKAPIAQLYLQSHVAKIIKVAQDHAGGTEYPEHVPQDGANAGRYVTKPRKFWTCGFLPAALYALFERRIKWPQHLPIPDSLTGQFPQRLLALGRSWNQALFENAQRTDTHDLGFMTIALRRDYELTMNLKSLDGVIQAAHNLASRYSERTRCIRSWNVSRSKAYDIVDQDRNFLVIIDSTCNLDLLYWTAYFTGDTSLSDKATDHAKTVMKALVRQDWSTFHCVNLDPASGEVMYNYTHQGYSETSCWTRGQAWAILGFTQTYLWTKETLFLNAAISLAEYFCKRLAVLSHEAPYVPPWDFDAPVLPGEPVLRDTSAGMIAANGLLLLHQILLGKSSFLEVAFRIIQDTIEYSLATDRAELRDVDGDWAVEGVAFPAILKHSTANNNANANVRYSNHGLIYADYYFLELGNKLLRLGRI